MLVEQMLPRARQRLAVIEAEAQHSELGQGDEAGVLIGVGSGRRSAR